MYIHDGNVPTEAVKLEYLALGKTWIYIPNNNT